MANQIAQKACLYKLAMKDEKNVEQAAILTSFAEGKAVSGAKWGGAYLLGLQFAELRSESDEFVAHPAPDGERFRPDKGKFHET
jgi:hypothetical protein